MSKITLLQCQICDLTIAIAQYPGAIYWDPTQDSLSGYSVDPDTVISAIAGESRTYLLNGLVEPSGIESSLVMQLINLYRSGHPELHLIIVIPAIEISANLYPFVSLERIDLPDADMIAEILAEYGRDSEETIKACLGLSRGEIGLLMGRIGNDVATEILDYKQGKLQALGFSLIPKPDVEVAGLDNLKRMLEQSAKLLEPEARQYGLTFPKGCLLWGIPGTGKTLAAKHAASIMGIPMIALDWNSLLSPVAGESESNLRQIFDVAEAMAPALVYADDFDKAFSSSDLSNQSSTEKRICGMLLTWLQDCDRPVFFMASVNRAEQMPPELLRRFTDIFFIDFPHQGQAKEVFDLHLAKYTTTFNATRVQWQQVLRAYLSCTPAEIGRAVQKCAERAYFEDRPQQITYQDLIEQRSQFVSGYNRDEAAILRIQKNAGLAIPATSDDNSEWKIENSKLFQTYLEGDNA